VNVGRCARALLVAVLVAGAACGVGCGGSAFSRAQGARFSTVPDPEPSRYADRKAVVVLEGQATYYSNSLAGNHTSNGDVYDPSRRTAASRDLPFDSIVRVIRRDTGAQVLVRINDRGPFGSHKRILDLSRAAAAALHMLGRGVAPVRAEVLVLGDAQGGEPRQK
jgi:rare lipoprotein A